MKFLTTLLLIIVSSNCAFSQSKSSFSEFSSKFREISFPFKINDSLAFEDWNLDDFITIDYVKEYNLITKYVNKDYPLELQDCKCSRIGKYKVKDYVTLLYKMYTTGAGRGNPKIILATYTIAGEKKDEAIVLWNDAMDPFYSQNVILSIPNYTTLVIKSTVKTNGYLQGEIVPKKITERIINYKINKDGMIEKKKDIVKNIFEDTNPNILDDFPDY